MCAINGFTFKDRDLILAMNKATAHRGPDATDVFLDEDISLGHNRLKIIDLSEAAKQPMMDSTKRYTLVFNGEIYNYKTLRTELEAEGVTFISESDTEVLIEGYRVWGSDLCEKLFGMFAFAIWDAEKEELFLARDSAGIKPLYYYHVDDSVIFSSEIKGILEHNIPRVLDMESFNHYMRVSYVPEPKTIFKDIHSFSPGHFATFSKGVFSMEKFTPVYTPPKFSSYKEAMGSLEDVLDVVIEEHLISDKPIGVYLSGGIDSSTVLQKVLEQRDSIDTFSVGFELTEGEESEKFNFDFNLARETAKHYGTNHHEVVMKSSELIPLFEKMVWSIDQPISCPTALSMEKLAQYAKGKVDVVLGGDGGDELFGGYPRYQMSQQVLMYQRFVPKFIRNILKGKFKKANIQPGIKLFKQFMFQKDLVVSRIVSPKMYDANVTSDFFEQKFFADSNKQNFVERFMKIDQMSWLIDFSFMLSDKITMSHGLEQRVPLRDERLRIFSDTLPLRYKVTPFETKKILRERAKKSLPSFLFNQPKRGWIAPGAKWLRRPEVASEVRKILSEDYNPKVKELFDWDEMSIMFEKHVSKESYNLTMLWSLLTFQLWAKKYDITIE